MTVMNRRTALGLLTAASAASCAGPTALQKTPKRTTEVNEVFAHGVASGDPDMGSVVLWTRISGATGPEQVTWELSRDEGFETILLTGTAEARPDADFTVKVIPTGLMPGETYYYRFSARGKVSPTGRTKTLPAAKLNRLGIALASCSNYAFGFFNAYQAIADDPAVDIVLHTGDYIYEYGADGWGAETAKVLGRVHEPAHEIVTLSDYRQRHAQYKTDRGSLAMHAAHPLIVVWDDHESTNNPWVGGAQNHQPESEGDWPTRRDASIQAYYEWMPIREPAVGQTRMDLWRSYSFGDLATLVTLETRHTARAQQIDYAQYVDDITSAAARDRFMADIVGAPDRPMISAAQEEALRTAWTDSVAVGQPWRLVGNASPIARMLVPDVVAAGILPDGGEGEGMPAAARHLAWKGKWNLPFYTDTWDGYPWAREGLYDLARASGARDLIFLTGDSHSFWANRLFDGAGQAMGLELGTAGISSPGDFVESGYDATTAEALDRVFERELDEVVWTDNFHQGYVRVDLAPDLATASFVAVDSVLVEGGGAYTLRQMTIAKTGTGLEFA